MISCDLVFNTFLEIEECKEKYYNIISNNKFIYTRLIEMIDEYPSELFNYFDWENTDDGFEFWDSIEVKWYDYILDIENVIREYKNKKWFKCFIRLLKENNIHEYYFNHVKRNDFIRITSPKELISSCILWDKTEQGNHFWSKLNNKWIKTYIKLNKQ